MEFFTKVVGVTFENRQKVCRNLTEGQKLLLVPEPSNKFDPNAVAVFTEEKVQVGYIPASNSASIVLNMRKGIKYNAFVASITGGGAQNYGVNIRIETQWN